MVRDIDIAIVIGANYGDEGKGKMTDYLASQAIVQNKKTIVVCSNGGAQRGHTVQLDNGYRHIFHHLGSGTLAGADTYLPQTFIVNPMIFMKEYNELLNSPLGRDTSLWPKIFVNPDCLISTPFDMMNNQIIEENRTHRHGSCGVGIWETILRQGATFYEMSQMTDEEMFNYLKWVRDTYSSKRLLDKKIKAILSNKWKDIYYNDQLIRNYIEDFRMFCLITHCSSDDILTGYDKIIFENGQGLLIDYDSDPVYSTPSHTGLEIPLKMIDILKLRLKLHKDIKIPAVEIYYITRSYYTRHGMGNLMYECDAKDISELNLNTETNQFNTNQGIFRYGKLYYDGLIERLKHYTDSKNKISDLIKDYSYTTSLVITHCDECLPPRLVNNELRNKGFLEVYKTFGPRRNDKIIKELLW